MIKERVVIPLLLSLTTGAILGALVGLFALWRAWDAPGTTGALVGCLAMAMTWISLLRRSGGDSVELSRFTDFTRLEKSVEPPAVRVSISHADGLGADWLDLPIDTPRMIAISERVLDGGSFSHASLAGPGRPLSRAEYETLRDVFLSRGLARWINPEAHSQGLRLTSKGRAVSRGFASMAAADLPRLMGKADSAESFYE